MKALLWDVSGEGFNRGFGWGKGEKGGGLHNGEDNVGFVLDGGECDGSDHYDHEIECLERLSTSGFPFIVVRTYPIRRSRQSICRGSNA